jgi:tetratricopeptide (TPR) repeat protein
MIHKGVKSMLQNSIFPHFHIKSIAGACFIFVILVLLITLVHAETIDSAYEIALAKAISKIESEDFEGARQVLQDILKTKPEDERATLYLGIALSRSGHRNAEEMLKKALSLNPHNPRTNLELGIYYYNKGMFDEARDYFDNTIQLASDSEYAKKAVAYIKTTKKERIEKRWAVNLSAGGMYDSNVVLGSGDDPLPQGITRRSDWAALFYLKGKYDLFAQKKLKGSTSYSFYQSFYNKLSDFNITSNTFDIRLAYHVTKNFVIKGEYWFDYVLVGGNTYNYAHNLSPIFLILEGNGFSTELHYIYKDSEFKNSDLFQDNSLRSGFNNLFKIIQNIPIADSTLLRVGYSHDVDKARVDYWSYKGNKGLVELKFTLPYRVFIDIYGNYYDKDYRGIYPGTTTSRRDKIWTGAFSGTKFLSDRFSLSLGLYYTDNNSNIDLFDYDRILPSLYVNVRF